MIKLVAFDWHGTIFSNTAAIYKSNKGNFKLLKLKEPTYNQFLKHYDVPVKKFYLAIGANEEEFDKKAKQIAQTFHIDYERRISKIRSRAFAKTLLDYLSKNTIRSVIFSNHIIESIKKQVKRLKMEKYFAGIIANSELTAALKGRCKKEKLKSYMDSRKFLPNETMIIGDTVEEIEIGKQLGVTSVAITHGNCATVRLKAAKPDYLISSLKEVIGIIKTLNN
ncbi:MAG: hypothetical protein UT04_C0044G0003 [Candidatus Daviesbacteria bacterium GW2011_GWF2_38_7]|nr:MAG: hypothetical protein UT04_C0044G0003 [Candidatus Daviesbacteria bacterium GW2011_GWF2_38_7]